MQLPPSLRPPLPVGLDCFLWHPSCVVGGARGMVECWTAEATWRSRNRDAAVLLTAGGMGGSSGSGVGLGRNFMRHLCAHNTRILAQPRVESRYTETFGGIGPKDLFIDEFPFALSF